MGGSNMNTPAVPRGYYNPYNPSGSSKPPALNADRYRANPFDINSSDSTERQRAQSYRDAVDKSSMDTAGKPILPEFQSALGEDGSVKDVYKLGAPPINMDALNTIRSQATGTGPSPWLQLQLQKQESDQAAAQDKAVSQNAGAAATARSALAMHGGVSSGAGERLAKSEMLGQNAASQGVGAQGASDRLNLQITDQANRQDLLKMLPQTELSYGQAAQDANKFNISNSLNDLLQKRAYDIGAYNQDMKSWAAGKTADAQSGGGKK